MRHFFIICMIPLLLTACSEKSLLSIDEKARYTIELLANRADCKIYGEKLSPPIADEKLVDQTYLAAKAAHCLKPSV